MKTILRWFFYGPGPSDGTGGRFLGMLLWWRNLVMPVLVGIPVVLGYATYKYTDDVIFAVLVTNFAAIMISKKIAEVSIKE